jgi:hypothetical protein
MGLAVIQKSASTLIEKRGSLRCAPVRIDRHHFLAPNSYINATAPAGIRNLGGVTESESSDKPRTENQAQSQDDVSGWPLRVQYGKHNIHESIVALPRLF